jgi:hypothetical protein
MAFQIRVGLTIIGILLLSMLVVAPSPTEGADTDYTVNSMPLPVSSLSTWKITCGYGCGLHQGGLLFSFDLQRTSGAAATVGQPVISPVRGKIAFICPGYSSGCINQNTWCTGSSPKAGVSVAIDATYSTGAKTGDRITLIHLDKASIDARPAIRPGNAVSQGTTLGTLKDIGSCTHLHVNHNRNGVAKELKLAGRLYRNCPQVTCWTGAQIRNNSLWACNVSCATRTGGTRVDTSDPNLTGTPVGNNRADYVIVNVGCRMQLFDGFNYTTLIATTSVSAVGALSSGYRNRTSSVKIVC